MRRTAGQIVENVRGKPRSAPTSGQPSREPKDSAPATLTFSGPGTRPTAPLTITPSVASGTGEAVLAITSPVTTASAPATYTFTRKPPANQPTSSPPAPAPARPTRPTRHPTPRPPATRRRPQRAARPARHRTRRPRRPLCRRRLIPDDGAVICDLRGSHCRRGPRRLVFELAKRGHPGVSRSTVYRVLVRHRLLDPVPRRRRRDQ